MPPTWCSVAKRTSRATRPSVVRTAVHVIKAEHAAAFLGHKLTAAYQDEIGNDFSTPIQGTRIRHRMGPVSLKRYDKFGLIARIETTANDAAFFKCCRSRYSAKFSQNNPRRICRIPPPLLPRLVSLDYAKTPWVLVTAAVGQERSPTRRA
jgi:hypothetical protein